MAHARLGDDPGPVHTPRELGRYRVAAHGEYRARGDVHPLAHGLESRGLTSVRAGVSAVSRCQIICELATAHGGDVALAEDMIRAAADSGADYAKVQTYSLDKLNPADPQADWLKQAHLDEVAHVRLMEVCQQSGIKFLSTPFDADSLALLRRLGLTTFKIASTESANGWWVAADRKGDRWFVSYPWGLFPPLL